MSQLSPEHIVKPSVLINQYPYYDPAGNKGQRIRVRYCCGHEKEWYSLDLGRMGGFKWKPQSNAQIMREELTITCPIGYRLCRDCAEAAS